MDSEHTNSTLLIVDDEINIVSSLKRLLRQQPYRILSVHSGKECMALLEQYRVSVILSECMPEMGGVEFLIRAKERYPDTVTMILSGYTELASITDAINKGVIYKFLTKPWDDELLVANLQEAFRYADMLQKNRRPNGVLSQYVTSYQLSGKEQA